MHVNTVSGLEPRARDGTEYRDAPIRVAGAHGDRVLGIVPEADDHFVLTLRLRPDRIRAAIVRRTHGQDRHTLRF